jgi:hypothetical protein
MWQLGDRLDGVMRSRNDAGSAHDAQPFSHLGTGLEQASTN